MKKLYLAKIGEHFFDPASGTEYRLLSRDGNVWDVLSSNRWSEKRNIDENEASAKI